MIITRTDQNNYAVETSTALADGSLRADHAMILEGHVLRSHERPGDVRPAGRIRVMLGPISFAKVSALAVGESVSIPDGLTSWTRYARGQEVTR